MMSAPHPGLCALCRHSSANTTRRGSTYWRCLRAGSDDRFARYPQLPVLRCIGFESRAEG